MTSYVRAFFMGRTTATSLRTTSRAETDVPAVASRACSGQFRRPMVRGFSDCPKGRQMAKENAEFIRPRVPLLRWSLDGTLGRAKGALWRHSCAEEASQNGAQAAGKGRIG
jgi:hypothetical protein